MLKYTKKLSVLSIVAVLLTACAAPTTPTAATTADVAAAITAAEAVSDEVGAESVEVTTAYEISVSAGSGDDTVKVPVYPVVGVTDELGHKLFIMEDRCLLGWIDLLTPLLLDEQVSVYSDAEAVWRLLNVNSDLLESGANVTTSEKTEWQLTDGTNQTYYASAYSYSSFVSFLRDAFTDEYVDELLSKPNAAFTNSDTQGDDRLFLSKNAREEKKLATRRKFDVIDNDDKAVNIKITVAYFTDDTETETRDETFTEKIVNTPNGWRMDGFSGWV